MRAHLFDSLIRRPGAGQRHAGTAGKPIPTAASGSARPLAPLFARMSTHLALPLVLFLAAGAALLAWPLLRPHAAPTVAPTPVSSRMALPAIAAEAPPDTAQAPAQPAEHADGMPASAPASPPVPTTTQDMAPPAPAMARMRPALTRPAVTTAAIRQRAGQPSAAMHPPSSQSASSRHTAAAPPLPAYSLNTVFPGQAWIQAGQRVVVVRVGDRLGNVTIERIDPVARRVLTSGGVIR